MTDTPETTEATPEGSTPTGTDAVPSASSDAQDAPPPPRKRAPRKRAAAKAAEPAVEVEPDTPAAEQQVAGVESAAPATTDDPAEPVAAEDTDEDDPADDPAEPAAAQYTAQNDSAHDAAGPATAQDADDPDEDDVDPAPLAGAAVLFQPPAPRRRRAASAPAGPPKHVEPSTPTEDADGGSTPENADGTAAPAATPVAAVAFGAPDPALAQPVRRARRSATSNRAATAPDPGDGPSSPATAELSAAGEASAAGDAAASGTVSEPTATADSDGPDGSRGDEAGESSPQKRRRRGRRGRGRRPADDASDDLVDERADTDLDSDLEDVRASTEDTEEEDDTDTDAVDDGDATDDTGDDETGGDGATGSTRRRRRRRRRGGGSASDSSDAADSADDDDPPDTVTHVREPRGSGGGGKDETGGGNRRGRGKKDADDDGVRGVRGSTRLEAKRQRRRDGRDTGRRRAPILTEAEFLARREAVDRVMAIRQLGDRTQIGVLEDDILVEHYVTRASSTSYVGNVYLGRVQNVLPSMEAAFVDIGKGRNGVLYAGEVNWDAAGLDGKARSIENALHSGDTVLVQVTKDPVGHKGARLTSQISLPGRYLVYVPGGGMTGISRRLPDVERSRLKAILKKVVPEDGGVIVRTAAEGASETDLARDVERLVAQWEAIESRAAKKISHPELVYGEPDLAIRVVRDVFNEDVTSLVVQGDRAYDEVSTYLADMAPELVERVRRHTGDSDLFHDLRIDEQLAKALDRKVWLPSGGSLVIDRTEAMTVVDVNTGKFVGSGGNLEQTVTRNNLEAAEEIVRQLRLRDVGGIVVIDFIDMVLESNRELVLRRLTECLGRDRTKHQVAEVTSLGLVQMTRKRVGEGLLEAFSEPCDCCHGRGVIVHAEPVDQPRGDGAGGGADADDTGGGSGAGRSKRRRGRNGSAHDVADVEPVKPSASDEQRRAAASAMAAMAKTAVADHDEPGDLAAIGALSTDALAATIAEALGQAGSDGAAGPDGPDGPDGADGPDNADGTSIDVGAADEDEVVAAEGDGAAVSTVTAPSAPAAVRPTGPSVDVGSADEDVVVTAEDAAAQHAAARDVAGEGAAGQDVPPAADAVGDPEPALARPRRRRAARRPAGAPEQ